MKLVRTIATGGFGRVDEVIASDGATFARKTFAPAVIPAGTDEYEKLKRRFAREVRVQSSLASPAFIPIVSADLESAQPSYLMPLAERNFQSEIEACRTTGTVPQQALADILNALDELHQLGFVHRDLKPQNVLLHEGLWKLTDFGLVLPLSTQTTKLTSVDSNWGTTGYCAPEQAIDFRGATLAVDVYAFGCILHDIYSGAPRVPYQRYSVAGAIGTVIEKCTEQRPEKRFKSVQALRGTLLTLLASEHSITASPKASEWATAVDKIETWSVEKAQEFARFVSQAQSPQDLFAVFSQIDEKGLEDLHTLDAALWKFVVGAYCDWVEQTGFQFELCDVVIKRLELIFEFGDLETKAAAVLGAAELGCSHNRWFVMGRAVRMCGPSLDDYAAQRIAIEIKAAEAAENFVRCAHRGGGISEYHPHIAAALE